MLSLRELQRAFSRTLFQEDAGLARDLVVTGNFSAEERLSVYRNNLHASLREALAAIYPVVQQLVGEAFFAATARPYVRCHPSRSGNLHEFGDEFPEFLEAYPAAATLPYLPDVARVELAWHRAFHAADAGPLDTARLAAIPPERYGEFRFALHPSATLIASPYPVWQLWAAHQPGGPELSEVRLHGGGEQVLVQREGLEVLVSRLAPGETALLTALAEGLSLTGAIGAALAAEPQFNLDDTLQTHLQRTTLVDAWL